MNRSKVLIFEDDRDLALLLERTFQKEGFDSSCCFDGKGFQQEIEAFNPNLVILDVMLPSIDGRTICRILKNPDRDREIKVIMLTAKSEEDDILSGYEAGADNYMTKPFSPKELVARARAILRRKSEKQTTPSHKIIRRDKLTIDDACYEISICDRPLDLTHSEYQILRTLANQPQRVYTREQLAESVSGNDYISPQIEGRRNIDVHIRSLRKKLDHCSYYIKTMRGVGYSFDTSQSSQPSG